MSISYNVYSNDGAGGPVDYGTILGTTSGLSWASPGLDMPSDTTFAVRAFDTGTGLEEQNVDARARVQVDGSGSDVSGLPNAPEGLTVTPLAGGDYRVAWAFHPGGRPAPAQFRVYVGTPAPSYAAPVATPAFVPGPRPYQVTLPGLSDGVAYRVVVRAANAAGEEPNAAAVPVTGMASGPLAVEALTSSGV